MFFFINIAVVMVSLHISKTLTKTHGIFVVPYVCLYFFFLAKLVKYIRILMGVALNVN